MNTRPECAGKTASLPPEALARYQADRQLFPPEQHLWANGLTRNGAWRYMRSSEKESAMGFPEGFTLSAWLTRDATRDVQGFEICRLDLLGQSLHVGLLKVFTQQLFLPSETLQVTNVARAAGASSENDVMGRLIKHLSLSGPPTHGPLTALGPHWWKWRTVISSRWKYTDHITALELQAHLASLRWRTRTPQCIGVRSLHNLDSQVALGILAKGRSPSLRLCRVVNKCNAICLTASYTTRELMSTLLTAPVERMTTMVKHTVTNRRAVLRRDQRALLGRLQDGIINSRTQLRYDRAVIRFFTFHRARRASPMCTNSWFDPLHFDLALCTFIESLWEEGDSKNEAIDCVSGMRHYLPQ